VRAIAASARLRIAAFMDRGGLRRAAGLGSLFDDQCPMILRQEGRRRPTEFSLEWEVGPGDGLSLKYSVHL